MKYKQFDVVKLKNGYNATILGINGGRKDINEYNKDSKKENLYFSK